MPVLNKLQRGFNFGREFFSNNCGQVDHSLSLNFCLLALPFARQVWTSTNGNQIEGEIFEIDSDRVGLRVKGRITITIFPFSKGDQQYI